MTAFPTAEAFVAIQQVLNDFWCRTDRVRDLPAEDLFAEDARIRIGTLALNGKAAIDHYHADRRASEDKSGRRVRHFCTNLVFEHFSGDEARVRCSLLVFQGVGEMPFDSSLPSNIADFLVSFGKASDERWLVTELDGTAIFRGPGAPDNAR